MAWRPNKQFVEGVLEVTGWMRFTGMSEKVVFDPEGNVHMDIRGSKVIAPAMFREEGQG